MRAVHLLYSRRDQQHFVNVNMLRLLLTASLVVILSTSASCKSSHDSAAGGNAIYVVCDFKRESVPERSATRFGLKKCNTNEKKHIKSAI